MKKLVWVTLGAGVGFATGRLFRLWSQDQRFEMLARMVRNREQEIELLHRHVNDMILAPTKEEIDNAVSWLRDVVQ